MSAPTWLRAEATFRTPAHTAKCRHSNYFISVFYFLAFRFYVNIITVKCYERIVE